MVITPLQMGNSLPEEKRNSHVATVLFCRSYIYIGATFWLVFEMLAQAAGFYADISGFGLAGKVENFVQHFDFHLHFIQDPY